MPAQLHQLKIRVFLKIQFLADPENGIHFLLGINYIGILILKVDIHTWQMKDLFDNLVITWKNNR